MSHRLRRWLPALALSLAVGVAGPALAGEKVVPASKAFPYLEAYLKLPPAERNHFTMAYYMRVGTQPLTAPAWIQDGERRTPLPLSPSGKVLRFPTAAQMADGKLVVGIDETTKMGAVIGIEPLTPPAADLDAKELDAAIAQAAVGQKKVGGIMAMAMPKLKEVGFVGAPSGEVEFADGHRAALPLVKGVPTYNPTDQPGARRIRLPKVPDKLDIS